MINIKVGNISIYCSEISIFMKVCNINNEKNVSK